MSAKFAVAAIVAALSGAASDALAERPPFDPERAPVGRSDFQFLERGEWVGHLSFQTRFHDGTYVIEEGTLMTPGIKESSAIVLDGETFAPISIVLDGDFNGNILDGDITFEDGKVLGAYRMKPPGEIAKRDVAIEREAPPDLIARVSVFALAAALPLEVGAVYPVTWFSMLRAQIEDGVTLEVSGVETTTVPAGTFETYRIDVRGSAPENVIYVAAGEAPKVVRIDVPALDQVFELLPPDNGTGDD